MVKKKKRARSKKERKKKKKDKVTVLNKIRKHEIIRYKI